MLVRATCRAVASRRTAWPLPRLPASLPPAQTWARRTYSDDATASSKPPIAVLASHKICAVPFRQTPEQALHRLHINGLIASASISNIFYAALLRLFGPAVTPLVSQWGLGASLTLKDVKAAYWPVWRVDYMGEGRVREAGGGRDRLGWVGAREAYVPGNPFAPLSYLSFGVPPLPDELETYDPATDLAQLGDEYPIVEVPFTVDPLRFADKLRTVVGRGKDVEGVRFESDEWKDTLFACYPLMFPIYVAEFESTANVLGEENRGFTVVMDAHDEVLPTAPGYARETNYWVNPAPFAPMLNVLVGLPPSENVHPGNLTSALAQAYQTWMSPPPKGSVVAPSPALSVAQEGASSAAGASGIAWGDARVQAWSSAERAANGAWVESSLDAYRALCGLDAVEAITAAAGGAVRDVVSLNVRLGKGGVKVEKKGLDEVKREHAETRARIRKDLEEDKPAWLKEWEGKEGESK